MANSPHHYLQRCARRRHRTTETTPITSSTTRTQLTPRHTCTVSCTIMSQRCEKSSHLHCERPSTIATPASNTYFTSRASHQGGGPCMEPPTTPTAPPSACYPNEPSMQRNRPSRSPTHRCGWRANGKHHHSRPAGHHPTPRTGHPKPDASLPTGGHTPRRIPATPGVAQEVTPRKSHAQRGHTNRTPPTDGWGST